ncbi:RimK/LysX family protein [Marinospirillum sp.]|uniref:ATP-dependent zinc protease n=1 Tax=Marinospirillum sp. TaxID=2183934 RepID=UPI00384AA9D7
MKQNKGRGRLLGLLPLLGLLSACQVFQQQEPVNQSQLEAALARQQQVLSEIIQAQPEATSELFGSQLQGLESQVVKLLESELTKTRRDLAELQEENLRLHRQHTFQIEELGHQVTGTQPSSEPGFNSSAAPDVVNGDGLLVFGRHEWVAFPDHGLLMSARVDSGANTSSMHAINIREFERDGDTWIRFTTQYQAEGEDEAEDIELEAPLVRRVTILQASGSESRPVVKLRMQLGSLVSDTEFTLTDRGDMSHPTLLGRRFMMDIALIDVSEKYLQPKPELEETPTTDESDS